MSESEKERAEELKRELGVGGGDSEAAELSDEDLAAAAGGVGGPRHGGLTEDGTTATGTIIFN